MAAPWHMPKHVLSMFVCPPAMDVGSESYAQAVKSTVITAPFYGKCPMEIAPEQDDTSALNNSLEPTVKATLVFVFLGCKWWNTRIEQFGEPPLANLLKFAPTSDQLRGRFRPSAQKLNQSTEAIKNVEPTKAA